MKLKKRKNLIYLILAYFVIIMSKLYFINKFGVDFPFDDQLDSEYEIYKKYLTGNLEFFDFFKQHNEHRIFFTKVLNLSIFILNGNFWSPILTMQVQSFVSSIIPIFCFYAIKQNQNLNLFSLFYVVIIFSLPICYENLLSGFQNQFYFLVLFSILSIYYSTKKRIRFFEIILITMFSISAYFSMASGFTVSIIISAIFFYRFLIQKKTYYLFFSIYFFLIGVILFLSIKPVPYHEIYKAKSIFNFIQIFAYTLGWPKYPFHKVGLFLFWIPISLFFVFKFRLIRYYERKVVFSFGLVFFILVTIAGISYARGGVGELALVNRYYDIMILILFPLIYLINKIENKSFYFFQLNLVLFVFIFFFISLNEKIESTSQKNYQKIKNFIEYKNLPNIQKNEAKEKNKESTYKNFPHPLFDQLDKISSDRIFLQITDYEKKFSSIR